MKQKVKELSGKNKAGCPILFSPDDQLNNNYADICTTDTYTPPRAADCQGYRSPEISGLQVFKSLKKSI